MLQRQLHYPGPEPGHGLACPGCGPRLDCGRAGALQLGFLGEFREVSPRALIQLIDRVSLAVFMMANLTSKRRD